MWHTTTTTPPFPTFDTVPSPFYLQHCPLPPSSLPLQPSWLFHPTCMCRVAELSLACRVQVCCRTFRLPRVQRLYSTSSEQKGGGHQCDRSNRSPSDDCVTVTDIFSVHATTSYDNFMTLVSSRLVHTHMHD